MSQQTIVLTGGGTGGHITPVLAVASELRALRPALRIVYVGQKGGELSDVPSQHPAIDVVYGVRAGKFRRFYNLGWRQFFDLSIQLANVRDALWVLVGIWQSYWLLRRLKPGIIFTRGGYVSVPVALAGRLLAIPYVTHDSDSTSSLANRLIAAHAAVHAVGLEPSLYPYPRSTTVQVGVPVSREYKRVNTKLQHQYKREMGLRADQQLLLVTGGGNGAESLNTLVAENAEPLLQRYPGLIIVQTAGRKDCSRLAARYDRLLSAELRLRVVVKDFINDLYRYSGAADVVIARAGASTLAELAIQGKACIVIPAGQLAWQKHQAKTLEQRGAIINLDQTEAAHDNRLQQVIADLLDSSRTRDQLAQKLAAEAVPDAAKRLARLLLDKMG